MIATSASLAIVLAAVLAGCGESAPKTSSQSSIRQAPTVTTPSSADRSNDRSRAHSRDRDFDGRVTLDEKPKHITNVLVRAEIQFHDTVPFDNMSLPLVSPGGRFIATQTRISPTWPTLLAEWEADVPDATRIEIYRRSPDGGNIEYLTAVHEPLILGRSFDEVGFLVEAPRDDGSRWIGYIEWDTGELHWLVADDFVNAFPSLGADGRLAWSRREINQADDHFEIVVRSPDGQEWAYGRERESWLMPTWAGRGNALFAFVLTGDYLEAVYAVGSDPSAFRQSQQRIGLARTASVYSAYQALGAQVASSALGHLAVEDQLVFFHPSRMRMAVWRPLTGGRNAVTLLNRNSFAAAIDPSDRAFVTIDGKLMIQRVNQPTDRAELLGGTYVPRMVLHETWPFVLLMPGRGEVGVFSMRPFAPDDTDLTRR